MLKWKVLIVLLITQTACNKVSKNKNGKINEIKKSTITSQFNLPNIPDSLRLIPNKSVSGDFNGDKIPDFAFIVKDIKTNKKRSIDN